MTFIDLFSGLGGFRIGMEQAGHTCLGHCEIDKYANQTYQAIHNIKEDEWFAEDITRVRADDIPACDCWCFGFPCQDISSAGNRNGLSGKRSSLFFAVTRLIRDTEEENRPAYLFIENVKNLLSVNRGFDFLSILTELDEIGYDAEWSVINSKYWVPQNRERIFIIGHFRRRSTRQVFPLRGGIGIHNENELQRGRAFGIEPIFHISMSESERRDVAKRHGIGTKEIKQIGNIVESANFDNPQRGRVYDTSGISPTLTTVGEVKILLNDKIRKLMPVEYWRLQGISDERFFKAKAAGLSDRQLYKQAGNGVTVPVIHAIAEKMEVMK